jgi:DNA-binding response OmpR family regulator
MDPKPSLRAYALRESILSMHPPRVLLADDDDDCRAPIAANLRQIGYSVVEARNGSALTLQLGSLLLFSHAKGDELPFGLVISDIQMPGQSGLDVLEGLRMAEIGVAVVIISADRRAETREKAFDLGADAFLQKPFELLELTDLCRTLAPVVSRSEAPKSWRVI